MEFQWNKDIDGLTDKNILEQHESLKSWVVEGALSRVLLEVIDILEQQSKTKPLPTKKH